MALLAQLITYITKKVRPKSTGILMPHKEIFGLRAIVSIPVCEGVIIIQVGKAPNIYQLGYRRVQELHFRIVSMEEGRAYLPSTVSMIWILKSTVLDELRIVC